MNEMLLINHRQSLLYAYSQRHVRKETEGQPIL